MSVVPKQATLTTLNIPQTSGCNSSYQQAAAAIIVPTAPVAVSDNGGSGIGVGAQHLGMAIQMAAMPIQVAPAAGGPVQAVQPVPSNPSVPVSMHPYNDASSTSGMQQQQQHVVSHNQHQQQVSYQSVTSIPVLGPGGLQYSIPVQSCVSASGLSRAQQAAVVTVPSYVGRPTAYAASYSGQQQQQQQVTTMLAATALPVVSGTGSQQQQQQHLQSGAELQQQQQVILAAAPHSLPQTITMPSGTTIQYNVNPSSIRQLAGSIQTLSSAAECQNRQQQQPQQQQQQQLQQPVLAAPVISLSSAVSSVSPLLSPGPPTLSPQIAGGFQARTINNPPTSLAFSPSSSAAVIGTKYSKIMEGGSGRGPPILTPPVPKGDQSSSDSLVPKSQLMVSQNSSSSYLSSSAVRSSPAAQLTYSSSYSYPQQLRIDPYQPGVYQAGYHHQPSPHGSSSSYHSPQGHSPAYSSSQPLGSPQHFPPAAASHSFPLSPVQYSSFLSSHSSPLSSPPAAVAVSVPPPMQHSPLTPSSQTRNNLQQQQQEKSKQHQLQLPKIAVTGTIPYCTVSSYLSYCINQVFLHVTIVIFL
jgi:hypothetical protein